MGPPAMTPHLLLAAADTAAHAYTYVGIGAGMCTIAVAVGLPTWKAFRTARHERGHQTSLISDIHGAIYGTAEKIENGVKVADPVKGLREEVSDLKQQFQEGSAPLVEMKETLDRNHRENSERLDQHEKRLSAVEYVAGAAATAAASSKDRLEFLSGRWWERMEGLDLRNQFLTSVAQEQGFDVGTMPPIDEDDDGSPDVHGR